MKAEIVKVGQKIHYYDLGGILRAKVDGFTAEVIKIENYCIATIKSYGIIQTINLCAILRWACDGTPVFRYRWYLLE